MQPGEFCRKVDLCEKVVSISQHLVNDKCNLCHQAVTEALMKLKDPHTQVILSPQLIGVLFLLGLVIC